MDPIVAALAVVAMVIGLVGVLVPIMPGLLVVWVVGVATTLSMGTDTAGWLVAGVLTVLFALGTAATVWLPARRGRQGGAPVGSFGLAMLGAVVGFVVIPVVGFLVGAFGAFLLAEHRRLGDWQRALRSVGQVVRAYGAGVLIELVVGVVMIATWAVAALAR